MTPFPDVDNIDYIGVLYNWTPGLYESGVNFILTEVANMFSTSIEKMVCKTRKRRIVYARQYAMWRIYNELRVSYKRVGDIFGLDHTTAMYAVHKFNAMSSEDIKAFLNSLKDKSKIPSLVYSEWSPRRKTNDFGFDPDAKLDYSGQKYD